MERRWCDQKLFRSIRCGCKKQRNYHRTFTSKAVAGVFAVFATGKYTIASGALPSIRHDIRDLTARLLTEVCPNVAVDPELQPLTGETLSHCYNSLLIPSLFDIFMTSVCRSKRRPAIAGRKRVEHTHIKESSVMPVAPKPLC